MRSRGGRRGAHRGAAARRNTDQAYRKAYGTRYVKTTVAIPVWNDQVSTTFDFAPELLVIETEGAREISRDRIQLRERSLEGRARKLRSLAVQVVLCGAVSQPLARAVVQAGIQMIPYVTGPVDDVLGAYLCGRLTEPRFLQPGCRPGARKRWRHGCGVGGQGRNRNRE